MPPTQNGLDKLAGLEITSAIHLQRPTRNDCCKYYYLLRAVHNQSILSINSIKRRSTNNSICCDGGMKTILVVA